MKRENAEVVNPSEDQIGKLETIKEIIRAMGGGPRQDLHKRSLVEPATITISPEEYGNHHTWNPSAIHLPTA